MSELTSKKNVETVKGMYESFAEGDTESVVGTWDPDIELILPEGFINGGRFHGQDEILENVFSNLANDWMEVSVVPERYIADEDTVVALMTWSGTYIETGKSVEFQGVHVFDFKNGKIDK